MTKIFFVYVENAGRSKNAEAFAKDHGLSASSAGTVPASHVNSTVVRAMRERGIDLSKAIPKMLTTEMVEKADLVVTMGCSVVKVCPAPMIARMQKGKTIEEVRRIRDEIEERVTVMAEKGSH